MATKPLQEGILILTTTPKREEAEQLAEALVRHKLAACVNILGPAISYYFWKGELVRDEEYKLFIKTSVDKKAELISFIKQNHSYTVPEITAIEVRYENSDYANWLYEYLSS
ncbi:MAG: divalent-cation tolerance protein CutA [Leptospiraceae bacterium]|nr:divalent-cation tolerance protein CutA [Leptospiraceae bacterium]MDW8306963.1 divalent-cation tolerance protein CutA [Leptospiraceae bacterium]